MTCLPHAAAAAAAGESAARVSAQGIQEIKTRGGDGGGGGGGGGGYTRVHITCAQSMRSRGYHRRHLH